MPRLLPASMMLALFLGPFTSSAAAVSIEELFTLKANGLTDEVLVALIETDGSVFRLMPEDVLALHQRGLGDKVILAMLATARRARSAPDTLQPTDPAPTVHQSVVQHVEVFPAPDPVVVHVPFAIPFPVAVHVPHVRPARPVYWGFGGQLRPDAWRPAPDWHSAPPRSERPSPKR